jgi:hypothetical protein
VVTAWINGVQYAQTTTQSGYYSLDVPGDDGDTPLIVEGGTAGQTVVFRVGGQVAIPNGTWAGGASVRLDLNAATSRCVSVQYQGHGAAGTAQWALPVTVTLYQPGNSTVVQSAASTSDLQGRLSIELQPGLPAVVDVAAKNAHTLSTIKRNVSLAAWSQCLDMGLLPEGDGNNNDEVDILDFSLLSTHYGEICPACDARVNFNEDGEVGIVDFSLLASNYGLVGPIAR